MRTKKEILQESRDNDKHTPQWDSMATLHERQTIEVLCDIRDILQDIKLIVPALLSFEYHEK